MARKMTRKEFQEIVHELAGRLLLSGYGKKAKWADLEELSVKWSTGGQSGGNCWDTDDDIRHYPESGEPEPEFEDLDNLLLEVAPQLSFLHYKKLMRLFKINNYRDNDYYGNYTDYATKSIKIDDIWQFLIDHDLIEEN